MVVAWRAGGHGGTPIAHWDIPHRQPGLIFTARGGSGAAYALSPGSQVPVGGILPDYVPEWRPPPPRVVYPLPAVNPQSVRGQLMAHDWGHLFREAVVPWLPTPDIPGFTGPIGVPTGPIPGDVVTPASPVAGGLGPESCEGMIWTGGVPPKGFKVVNWCGQGVLRKVRRRRRRRILTASDKADISYIVATVGKGQLAASLVHKSSH